MKNRPPLSRFMFFNFCFFFIFSIFSCFVFFHKTKSFFFFSCLSFKTHFVAGISITLTTDVSSVVGAPWRCGVLTTKGGMAGIGLGHLLGREHDSTPQSVVEAPRLLERNLSRLYCCCCVCTDVRSCRIDAMCCACSFSGDANQGGSTLLAQGPQFSR